jgi:hypothetical protein
MCQILQSCNINLLFCMIKIQKLRAYQILHISALVNPLKTWHYLQIVCCMKLVQYSLVQICSFVFGIGRYFVHNQELDIIEWTKFIINEPQFTEDIYFIEKCMSNINKHYSNLSKTDKSTIVSILARIECIITERGIFKPSESYFKYVSLFSDLPRVCFSNPKSISDKFLADLGVRAHVDLQLVFDRLSDLSWNQQQLIKYLASIQDKLDSKEYLILKNSPIFLMESKEVKNRFLAKELYTPIEKFDLFGLPILQWSGKWKYMSDEG